MEIIVVDDFSNKDDPEPVVRKIAGDRIQFIRQSLNVGKVRNFETGLLMSSGRLIHQLHGDDAVGSNFYKAMENAFAEFPEAGAFFCESRYVTETGEVTGRTGIERDTTGMLDDWTAKIATSQRIQAPSIVVNRLVYETLGGFDRRIDMVEDWEMWIRIANSFPVGFVRETHADYTVHTGGTSGTELTSGRLAERIRTMLNIVDSYLPVDLKDRIEGERRREIAQYLMQQIPQMAGRKDRAAVIQLWRQALSFDRSPRTLYRLAAYTLRGERTAA